MNRLLKSFGAALHRALAKSRLISRIYFTLLPLVARRLPRKARQQLRNSIQEVRWPEITLPAKPVVLGRKTRVRLRPHFGEFDFEALLATHPDYENEVFRFTEERIAGYDVVIEIGANIGLFTTFVAAAARARSQPLKVYAFEPSNRAYARLIENLQLNDLNDVDTFNCAVADKTGFADFFEPMGHITNGSLDRAFASQFSAEVRRTNALVINGELLDKFVGDSDRVLIKIDVEGDESCVLRALEKLMRRIFPDLLIEVLPSTASELNQIAFLKESDYQLLHLTGEGPVERSEFLAGATRDYFLTPTASHRQISRDRTAALV